MLCFFSCTPPSPIPVDFGMDPFVGSLGDISNGPMDIHLNSSKTFITSATEDQN